MHFCLYLNGVRRGPFSAEQVKSYLENGLLQLSDLASDRTAGELKPLATFRSLDLARAESPPPDESPIVSHSETTALAPQPVPASAPAPPSLALQSLGPYARATLAPNETPYHKTSLHWIVFVRFALLALATFFFLAIPFAIAAQALTGSELGWFALPLPAFIFVAPTLAYVSSELVITDLRVLIKTGIIQRQTLEMSISKVESIGIDQGFFGRLFDYGTVTIRGTGGFQERFESIAHPVEFRNWVQRVQSRA